MKDFGGFFCWRYRWEEVGFPEDENEDNPLYVISTESECYGAAVILYPGFLEKTAAKLESDFFLLPSSLHEMVLVKDDGNLKTEELIQMVKEINASEVRAEDKLTDSVYYYNRKKQQLRRVEAMKVLWKISISACILV